MFREMRRIKQQMPKEEIAAVFMRGTSGVLAVLGDDEYPYAVPMSYVYDSGRIYFHCAKAGHKLDAIRAHEKVSFCVIDQDIIVPEKYTTLFRSVIAFGRARILEEETEVRRAIEILTRKYSPKESDTAMQKEIESGIRHMDLIEVTIEHMTGKESMELINRKSQMQ